MVTLKFDSCSLIYMIKADAFEPIYRNFSDLKITLSVKKECVDQGIKFGHKDAYIIDDLISKGKIQIEKTIERSKTNLSFSLGAGETETIFEAENEGCYAILNDQKSRAYASRNGVKNITLEILLLDLLSSERMKPPEFDRIVSNLANVSGMKAERVVELFELKKMISNVKQTRNESGHRKE